MKRLELIGVIFSLVIFVTTACGSDEPERKSNEPKAVSKTNSTRVYMHYMPWFQSKDVSGYWGSHWTMKNKNPETILDNGQREIASHYYPLIGPYDSKDLDVIQYHLLLMKYAGVDGVLIDWYGSHNVYDYRPNLSGANALIDNIDDVGLQFGIVYEEFTAESVDQQTSKTALQAAQVDVIYMRDDSKPLLLTFGPRYFKQGSQWESIFSVLEEKPIFLPLWNHSGYTGATDDGEYAWVDFTDDLSELDNFYNKVLSHDILMGSAFPRFHDFYAEGGAGTSYGYVDADGVNTLTSTLAKATNRRAQYVQLVTWNDFGEGTVIEPTVEDEFSFLETIQKFTGVSYSRVELELVHQYYLKRKELKGDAESAKTLDAVFQLLVTLEVEKAKDLLQTL
jgi:hypothetical protein